MAAAIKPNRGGSRRQLADKMCPQCKRPFRPRTNETVYCSKKCLYDGLAIAFTGRKIVQQPPCAKCCKPVKRAGKKYCSRKCYDSTLAGRKASPAVKAILSVAQKKRWDGKRNPAKRALLKRMRMSQEWAEWRRQVFERDNYTCQKCGKRGVKLEPHHIKKLADRLDLAYDVDNGQTLCIGCHKETPNWGMRRETTNS